MTTTGYGGSTVRSDGSGPVAALYATLAAVREPFLREAELAAALTYPPTCVPSTSGPWKSGAGQVHKRLPVSYQSFGARCVNHLCGIVGPALYAPGSIWFRREVEPRLLILEQFYPGALDGLRTELFMQELTLNSLLESAHNLEDMRSDPEPDGTLSITYRRKIHQTTFYSAKFQMARQTVVTGDCLEYFDDDYRLRVLPRNAYCNVRDGSGNIVCHTITEMIDPAALRPAFLEKANITPAHLALPRDKRLVPLVTLVEWQPRSGTWVYTQEVNGHEVNVVEEKVCRYISTAMDLVPEEDYGRGMGTLYSSDLTSINTLVKRVLDAAGIASKMVPCIDASSPVDEEDLELESGMPIRARVRSGVVEDIAFLQTQKSADLSFAISVLQGMEERVGKAFLLASESVRQSERTTAFEVQETVIRELQGAQGGIYATMAPAQHNQQYAILEYQAIRDGYIQPIMVENPADKKQKTPVKVVFVTGQAALTRQAQQRELLTFLDVVRQFPDSEGRINWGTAMQAFERMQSFYMPSLVRSDAEVAAVQQEAIKARGVDAAIQKGVEVMGNAAESRMLPAGA